jgi:hypothetical protein
MYQSPPLQTEFSFFCKMKYLLEKEIHNKNEENTLKELNEIFLMVQTERGFARSRMVLSARPSPGRGPKEGVSPSG